MKEVLLLPIIPPPKGLPPPPPPPPAPPPPGAMQLGGTLWGEGRLVVWGDLVGEITLVEGYNDGRPLELGRVYAAEVGGDMGFGIGGGGPPPPPPSSSWLNLRSWRSRVSTPNSDTYLKSTHTPTHPLMNTHIGFTKTCTYH